MTPPAKNKQITVPEGRVVVLSLSGTERTDWAVGLLLLVAAAFGLGALAGRLTAPAPADRRR